MTPDQAQFLAQQYAQLMHGEFAATRKVLAAVKDDTRDYRPDDKSRTAWELATHLATADVWFLDSIITGQFVWDPEKVKQVEGQFTNVAEIVAFYEKTFPEKLKAIAAMTAGISTIADSARRPRSFQLKRLAGGESVMGLHPAVAAVAAAVFLDGRGQGFLAVVGPQDVLEHQFGVGGLPEQEIRQAHLAGGGSVDPGNRLDQRRLARAVVAGQRDDLAGMHRQRHLVERAHGPEMLGQAAYFEKGGGAIHPGDLR